MKKYKHGMVLGKFYPLHKGHLYLINTASEQCDEVTLFVCSLKSETIPGELRYKWLRKIYENTNVRVIHIKEELPQKPEEDINEIYFYEKWCNAVYSNVRKGDLDVIFTSEEYGDEFSSYLNVEHVLVDLPRLTHSVSGTSIRNNPIENWEHIPDVVRPYFKKKIVVVGPESTGKSTLTKKLSEHFKGDLVQEFGREYTDENPAKEMDVSQFEEIAHYHKKLIDKTFDEGDSPFVFIDTEALTTYIFGQMYLGPKFYSEKIMNIVLEQKFDLILLCDIDVPWVDDGTRDFPHKREEHFHQLKSALKLFDMNYKLVCGNYDDRFRLAKKYVNEII
jgi:HTH-type transcriptional regulator, transcriptional repressor of NAD biosynthesis genes